MSQNNVPYAKKLLFIREVACHALASHASFSGNLHIYTEFIQDRCINKYPLISIYLISYFVFLQQAWRLPRTRVKRAKNVLRCTLIYSDALVIISSKS